LGRVVQERLPNPSPRSGADIEKRECDLPKALKISVLRYTDYYGSGSKEKA
jgi:hypothetical protein